MQRNIVLVIGDTHAGHILGLLRPNTMVDMEVVKGEEMVVEKVELPINPVQHYLNKVFDKLLRETKKIAGDDKIILLHGGDITHGNRYVSQLVSSRISVQCQIAERIFTDSIDLLGSSTVRLLKGTANHVFDEGGSDNLIASALEFKYPDKDILCYYHGTLDIDGVIIDVAHHGPPPGSRKWLEGNELRYHLRSRMMDEIMNQKVPPSLYLRFHYHRYMKETVSVLTDKEEFTSTIILCPSFCMADDYAIKVVKSPDKFYSGGIILEIVDGKLMNMIPKVVALDIRIADKI